MKIASDQHEFDFEQIPLLVTEIHCDPGHPTDEELAIITASLHLMFPCDQARAWDREARLQSTQTRL